MSLRGPFSHTLTLFHFIYWKHTCAHVIRVRSKYVVLLFANGSRQIASLMATLCNRHVMWYSLISEWMEQNRIEPNKIHLNCKQISNVFTYSYMWCVNIVWIDWRANKILFPTVWTIGLFIFGGCNYTRCLLICMQFAWMNHSETKCK